MKDKRSGFTLLELLIVMSVSVIVGTALITVVVNTQKNARELALACERNQNFRLLPLVFSQTVSSAGSGFVSAEQGVEANHEWLKIKADLDGPKGFPDGSLDQSYEDLQFRINNHSLQIKSGKGNYQPIVLYVETFLTKHHGKTLTIEITGEKRSFLNTDPTNQVSLDFYLWNYRPCLFEKEVDIE